MTETEKLISADLRLAVERNLGRDPLAVALDRGIADASLVASQVKYLQKARRKLPSYYAARCVIPPLAFEQSSGEDAAARKDYTGELCIDLTCGLGVDSFYLSKRFGRVVSVERSPELAAVARENFRRLGARNIEVVNTSAEEFLSGFAGHADLVYADPDRRSAEGRKMVRIEDCSPDITSLLPRIRTVSARTVVKLSPLFDVDEVFRVFGAHTRAEVVSQGGECKEVIAESCVGIASPVVRASAIGLGDAEYPAVDGYTAPERPFTPERYRWLVVPDVALRKSRTSRRYFAERADYIESDNGYAFSSAEPRNVMGRVFEIESLEPYDPKGLKRRLKDEGVKGLDILKREFPLSSAEIARRLGVREGGTASAAFTKADGRLWQAYLRIR